MLSYRTPEEFGERFDAPPVLGERHVRVAAEDYLEAAGAKFVSRIAATGWLRLSESIDLHAIDPAAVRVPTLVVAVEAIAWCRCPTRWRWSRAWARAAACACCARRTATTPS